MFEEEAGEMCSVVPGNCFLCCDFWKSYCFKTAFPTFRGTVYVCYTFND